MQACDRLLVQRVEAKMKGKKVGDVLNRLHVAMPAKRDNRVCILVAIVTPCLVSSFGSIKLPNTEILSGHFSPHNLSNFGFKTKTHEIQFLLVRY